MAIRKPAIPAVTPTNIGSSIGAIKETIEIITGARGGELTQLATTATTADIITKINQIVIRLNASGT
jgi:hypothetical protein